MAKAGILGTGWIAELHARTLRSQGIEIAAVVGHSEENTQLFADKWSIPYYGIDMDLLYEKSVDCVHICTPPKHHHSAIKALLSHGKHVLCEKPLCLDIGEAEELSALAENSDLICAVGFNIRYYLACNKAKKLVQSDDFGRILLIHGSYLQEFGASPAQYSWRYADKLHAVTEIGSHWLDLVQYISGKRIISVSTQFDRFHPLRYAKDGMLYSEPVDQGKIVHIPSEDVALLSLRFEDGAIGSVVLSELSHGRKNSLSFEITGERQSLWWSSDFQNNLYLARKGASLSVLKFEDHFDNTFSRLIQEVYHAIEVNKPCGFPTFAEAQANVRLCEALWQSAENNSCWTEVLR